MLSLPSRERGLKSIDMDLALIIDDVAPLAGAWIEIEKEKISIQQQLSLPSRERGLKLVITKIGKNPIRVAPLAGAWIEIVHKSEAVL